MRLLIALFFVMLCGMVNGQMIAEYNFLATSAPPGAGTYGMNGFFLDTDGRGFTVADVKVDTTYFFDSNGRKFIVKSKAGNSPFQLGLDAVGHTNSPSTGIGQLTELAENGMPYFSGGVSDKLRATLNAEQMTVIDPLLGVGGAPNYQFYVDDADAAAGGVPVGGLYRAEVGNRRGLSRGVLTTRLQ